MNPIRRVLVVHNRYRQRGGEDALVEQETALLREAGCEVGLHLADSTAIAGARLPERAWRALQVPYSLTERRRLAARLATETWDLVHIHNLSPFLSASILGALPHALPRVMTLHNFRSFCVNGLFLRDGRPCEDCPRGTAWHGLVHRCHQGSLGSSALLTAAQWTARHVLGFPAGVDLFLCPSRFLLDRHVAYGFPADRLRHLPNFSPERAPGGATERGRAGLYVGRLDREKGTEVLLAALRLRPELEFDVAGTGPLEPALRALAASRPGVRLHGWLPPAGVARLMERAGYLVMPSICYENQPLALIEGLAAALPIVATGTGALGEMVTPGVNGWLVPTGDAASLAAALAAAAELSASDRERLGAASRHAYRAAHSPAAHLARLTACYADAAAARATARA